MAKSTSTLTFLSSLLLLALFAPPTATLPAPQQAQPARPPAAQNQSVPLPVASFGRLAGGSVVVGNQWLIIGGIGRTVASGIGLTGGFSAAPPTFGVEPIYSPAK